MALYDGLPLNTPTLIREDTDIQVWATRTTNGGTVENRVKANSDADRSQQLQARLQQAIAANTTYVALAAPSVAQNTTQLKTLTRQVQALLRMRAGQFDSVD